jgi:hypothetical protein
MKDQNGGNVLDLKRIGDFRMSFHVNAAGRDPAPIELPEFFHLALQQQRIRAPLGEKFDETQVSLKELRRSFRPGNQVCGRSWHYASLPHALGHVFQRDLSLGDFNTIHQRAHPE